MSEHISSTSSDYVRASECATNISYTFHVSRYNASNAKTTYAFREQEPPNLWAHFWIYMTGITAAFLMAIKWSWGHGYYIFTALFTGLMIAEWIAVIYDLYKLRKRAMRR